mgnify:CR=1 FL=1
MSLRTQMTLLDVSGITAGAKGGLFDLANLEDMVFELRATETVSGTSLDVKLEDSFDGGVTWNDWIVFTQLAITGAEVKAPTRPPGGDVRVDHANVGGTWDIRVKGSANPQR